MPTYSEMDEISWQEFEEAVKEIFEKNDFRTEFRFVFKDEVGRSEIDIVAERFGTLIGVDAKRYNKSWNRKSAIKREALKHGERCKRLSRLKERKVIPVIVSLIDDSLISYQGCIIVPFNSLNDFLVNFEYYIEELGY